MRILPLAAELDYRTVMQYLKLPKPSGDTLRWMAIAVLGAILVFVLYEVVARIFRRTTEKKRSEEDFEQLSLVCGLTPEEIRMLRHLIGICNVQYPDRLMTSFEFFNQCLEEKGPAASGPLTKSTAERLKTVRNKIFFGERSKLPPIKSTRELAPNQRLHMKRVLTDEVFMTPVVDAGTSGLLVATPRVKDEYVEMEPGEQIEAYFWRERDAGYSFESEVVGQSGTHYLITILRHIDGIERAQRRQYHRVAVLLPVEVTPVTREGIDKISSGEKVDKDLYPSLQAYIVDMSGTGFAFAGRTALRTDDIVYVELKPDDGGSAIPIIGKILNVTKKAGTDEFLMHAEFVGLAADTHERILHFVYSQARGVAGTA